MTNADASRHLAVRQDFRRQHYVLELEIVGERRAANGQAMNRHAESAELGEQAGIEPAARVRAVGGNDQRGQRFAPGIAENAPQGLADAGGLAAGLQPVKGVQLASVLVEGVVLHGKVERRAGFDRAIEQATGNVNTPAVVVNGHTGRGVQDHRNGVLPFAQLFGLERRLCKQPECQRHHRGLECADGDEPQGRQRTAAVVKKCANRKQGHDGKRAGQPLWPGPGINQFAACVEITRIFEDQFEQCRPWRIPCLIVGCGQR